MTSTLQPDYLRPGFSPFRLESLWDIRTLKPQFTRARAARAVSHRCSAERSPVVLTCRNVARQDTRVRERLAWLAQSGIKFERLLIPLSCPADHESVSRLLEDQDHVFSLARVLAFEMRLCRTENGLKSAGGLAKLLCDRGFHLALSVEHLEDLDTFLRWLLELSPTLVEVSIASLNQLCRVRDADEGRAFWTSIDAGMATLSVAGARTAEELRHAQTLGASLFS